MGGIVSAAGSIVSTAAGMLGVKSAESNYYKDMAYAADEQARLVEENNRRQTEYLFRSASYDNKQTRMQYNSTLAAQKTALAASGLGSSSTAQTILRNSRLNALLDEETQRYNLNASVYERGVAASQEAGVLRNQASQYRRARKNSSSWWRNLWDAGQSAAGSLLGKNK